jgi:hypothetical protein
MGQRESQKMKKIIETIIKYCNVFFFKEGSEKLPKS